MPAGTDAAREKGIEEDLETRIEAALAGLQQLLAEWRAAKSGGARHGGGGITALRAAAAAAPAGEATPGQRWYQLLLLHAPRFAPGSAERRTPRLATVARVAAYLADLMNESCQCHPPAERELVELIARFDGGAPLARGAIAGCLTYLRDYGWLEERRGVFRGMNNKRRAFTARLPEHVVRPRGPDDDGPGGGARHVDLVLAEVVGRVKPEQTSLLQDLAAPPPGAPPGEELVHPGFQREPPAEPEVTGQAGGSASGGAGPVAGPAYGEAGPATGPACGKLDEEGGIAVLIGRDVGEAGPATEPASPRLASQQSQPFPQAGFATEPASPGLAPQQGQPSKAGPATEPAFGSAEVTPFAPQTHAQQGDAAPGRIVATDETGPASPEAGPATGPAFAGKAPLKEEEEDTSCSFAKNGHDEASVRTTLFRIGEAWAQEVASGRSTQPGRRGAERKAEMFDALFADVRQALDTPGLWLMPALQELVPFERRPALWEAGLAERRRDAAKSVRAGVRFAVVGEQRRLQAERAKDAALRQAAAGVVPEGRAAVLPAPALQDDAWGRACERYRPRLAKGAWRTWLAPTSMLFLTEDGTVTVATPNPFAGDWIAEHYGPDLESLIGEELGRKATLVIVYKPPGGTHG
jgi:hypothetical protein